MPPEARDPHFVVVSDVSGFDALAEAWNGLAERRGESRMGFQSFAWMRSASLHYADQGGAPHLLLGYVKGRLALIWPLRASRFPGLTILEDLGEPLCQYHDAIIDAEAPADLLVAGALRHLESLNFDALILRRVREDSALTPALLVAGARITRTQRAPYIDFAAGETSDDFEQALSGKARGNRRRRLRRLQEIGEISHESDVLPERAEQLIGVALDFKRAWALAEGRYAPAVFDIRFERCLRDAARRKDPDAALRVFALLCGGRPIGVEISFGYKGRLFAHVLAHDPRLAKFGVGVALADATIRDAYAHGYRLFDLLAPADPYKTDWARRDVAVHDLLLARTRRGALFGLAKAGAIDSARRAATRAPPLFARALMRRAERRRVEAVKPDLDSVKTPR